VRGIKRIDRGKRHWYTIDGVKADGVTTLIGGGFPKPALIPWAARSVAEYVADNRYEVGASEEDRLPMVRRLARIPFDDRDRAAEIGTRVHVIAEQLSRGEEVEVPDDIAPYVDSCVRFLDDWDIRPILTETVVASRTWRYAGTLDGVWYVPSLNRVVVGDYKTSRSGLWPEVALQVAAYRHAEVWLDGDGNENPMADLNITGGLAVLINRDGYEVREPDTSLEVHKTFLHVAWVSRQRSHAKKWLGDPLPNPNSTEE
jgi:hypothetical protein